MYTSKTRSYSIDLALPEGERWAEVISEEKAPARKLAKQALREVHAATDANFPSWMPLVVKEVLAAGARTAFTHAYAMSGGRYTGEMKAWADALGVSVRDATILNCTYELSAMCTAGVVNSASLGMVHVRTLDWPLSAIGEATRLFRFHRGDHEFVAVGIVGHVGVLSGMVPGAYSVTINWAPPGERPGFDFGPAFLLREVLETCTTYAAAVATLRDTQLAAPVFYTVCGAKPGQACVVERTRGDAAVRAMKGKSIVQANHHVAQKFVHRNELLMDFDPTTEDMSRRAYSGARADALDAALQSLDGGNTLDDVAACLDVELVCNDETFQQMVFVPATGDVKVWRWIE